MNPKARLAPLLTKNNTNAYKVIYEVFESNSNKSIQQIKVVKKLTTYPPFAFNKTSSFISNNNIIAASPPKMLLKYISPGMYFTKKLRRLKV